MGNFFSSVNESVFRKAPGGDTNYSDPLGSLFSQQDQLDEEEKRRKQQEAEQQRLRDILQGKIDALAKAREMPSLTSSDTRLAGRRARASLLTRGGRSSTLLSQDPLGGL